MNEIAANPDYLRTGQSTVMDTGAPIVFGDIPAGALIGREITVTDGKGDRVKVRYAVVDASDLIPSHQADGTPIAAFANGEPGKLRVVAGSGASGLEVTFNSLTDFSDPSVVSSFRVLTPGLSGQYSMNSPSLPVSTALPSTVNVAPAGTLPSSRIRSNGTS